MPAKSTNPIGAFIVGRLLAERAGLSSTQATQWGAVLMATGLSPASILLVSELARLDADNLAAQAEPHQQLQAAIEQAVRNSQTAVEKLEQVTVRLDQLSDRLSRLEAHSANACNQATCAEILAALRELRDGQDARCRERSKWQQAIVRWLRRQLRRFTRFPFTRLPFTKLRFTRLRFARFWTRLLPHYRPRRRKPPR